MSNILYGEYCEVNKKGEAVVSCATLPYNTNMFAKPTVGVCVRGDGFLTKKKPCIKFVGGSFIGDRGAGGRLLVRGRVGDIIGFSQLDYSKKEYEMRFYLIKEDGFMELLEKDEVYKRLYS